MNKINWRNFAPGVRSIDLGDSSETITSHTGVLPRLESLMKLPETPLPDFDIEYQVSNREIILKMPLADDECIYGIGLKFKGMRQYHAVTHLRMDHYGSSDNGRTHAPVPFHVSTAGYGLLIDSPCPISYYVATAHRKDAPNPPIPSDRNTDPNWSAYNRPDYLEITIQAPGARLVLFTGTNMLDTLARFNLYCGGGCLPPRWGLGFWLRPVLTATQTEVEELFQESLRQKFPLEVMGLEPGWQSNSYPCTYEWSKKRFPNPAGMCTLLAEAGVRVNLWENPYVSPKAEIYRQLFDLSGSHNVWCGIVPDYTMPEVRKIIADQHEKAHFSIGIGGYKLDEADGKDNWLWPDHAVFPSGRNGFVVRSVYGLCCQRMTMDIYRRNNTRTYGLSRASNAGGSVFPYVLYNDNYDFNDYVTAICNCGFIGMLWTPEVRQATDANDWLRRMQLAALSPMAMLNGWASSATPWQYPECNEQILQALNLRRKLMPYLYSAFAKYHFEGVPPFRALVADFGAFMKSTAQTGVLDDTLNPYQEASDREITDQYMMGDSMMVAVVRPGETERQIVLPPGKWYDFYTGALFGEGGIVSKSVGPLDPFPLLIRDSGIIPTQQDDVLKVRIYGTAAGEFLLYDDDGTTFDYESGHYNLTRLTTSGQVENVHGKAPDTREIIFINM